MGREEGRLCRKYRRRNSKLGPIEREEYFVSNIPGEGGGGGEGIITITRACKPTNDDPSSCAGLS